MLRLTMAALRAPLSARRGASLSTCRVQTVHRCSARASLRHVQRFQAAHSRGGSFEGQESARVSLPRPPKRQSRGISSRLVLCCAAAAAATAVSVEVPPRSPSEILGGWLRWGGTLLFIGIPIWIAQGLQALLAVTLGYKVFFKKKDRSAVKFADPFEHGFVEVNGYKLHTVTAGKGKGKPLMLCLHGFPELWFSWRKQMLEFQDDYEVVAIDMRGYGESDKPLGKENYVIPALASDAAAVIKALGHEKCTLLGHDWGGMVAWFTAALYPEVVERLVVMGLPHPISWRDNMDMNQRRRSWYIIFFQCPWLPEFLVSGADCKFIEDAFKHGEVAPRTPGAVTDEDIERYKQGFARPGAATASINYYRSFFDYETRWPSDEYRRGKEVLRGKLPMPVLMLYAANDSALGPQLVRGTEKYVPDLELHVLEDCSHWVQQDQPARVHALMRAFIQRTSSAGRAPAAAAAGAA